MVSCSRAEADFRVMALVLCELIWLKILMKELRLLENEPMKLYCDNKAAINIATIWFKILE